MTYEKVMVAIDQNHVVELTLNRPDQLNTLDSQMAEELNQALIELDADPQVRVVLLKGRRQGFLRRDRCQGAGRQIGPGIPGVDRAHGAPPGCDLQDEKAGHRPIAWGRCRKRHGTRRRGGSGHRRRQRPHGAHGHQRRSQLRRAGHPGGPVRRTQERRSSCCSTAT